MINCLNACETMRKEKVNCIWYFLMRGLCRIFCKILFRVQISGRENVPDKGPFLLASNHQSFLDPLFCGTPLRRHLHFLARDTLFRNKFFGWLIRSVNAMPVQRGRADLSAMKKIIGKLKEGKGVCLFPEGTRTPDGKIKALRPGFGLIAKRGDAIIVPVLIDGAFEAWPRHRKMFSSGCPIMVCYGKAISAEQIKGADERELAEQITETLRQMQSQTRQKHGKQPYDYS